MEGVAGFDYAETGLPVGPGEIEHPIDFRRFSWNWRLDRLLQLLESTDDVFICAITSNTVELAHLFDRIPIDAGRPLETIVDEILARLDEGRV
jgi:hypothetical protein